MGPGSRFVAALVALGVIAVAQARPSEMRIQYAEPVDIAPANGTVQLDAYGRRFTLELSTNDRLLASFSAPHKAQLARYRVMRGKLAGQPGSWVRLTSFSGRVEGAIWDGQDLYAVTRYADIAQALATPLDVRADQTVTFRLSDTYNALPKNFCAVEQAPDAGKRSNALAIYKTMVSDLRANAQVTPVTRQMDVALIADAEFQTLESVDPTGAMVARLNIADGIYADQVGLLLNAGALVLVPKTSDPFTTNDPSALLQQVSTYRAGTASVKSAAIAHLVTGKSLTGTTLGIARIGGVCTVSDGISLSQGTLGVFMTGLIMAHELGHNLGAEHDGSGACSTVGDGYIMWPSISSSARRFSQCSLDAMRPFINGASCLGPASVADVMVGLNGPSQVERDVPANLTATVVSIGANLARDVEVSFNLPGNVTASAITASGGNCTLAPTLGCTFGDLAAGEQRSVTLTITAHSETVQAMVSTEVGASNDRVVNNNTNFTTFAVVNNADAAVSVQPGAATVRTGDPVDYTITITSIRTATVRNASMVLTPSGLNQVTYTPSA
ncbi:MAG TPA: zinc-dependent metalloprotease family protein, partial [Steroidobacteraceae bacterium]